MSEDGDKKLEEYIKNCIKEIVDTENKKTNFTKPVNKKVEVKEDDLEHFDDILKFVANTKTGQAGILLDSEMLNKWNKSIVNVLLDNIEASLKLLKEELQ